MAVIKHCSPSGQTLPPHSCSLLCYGAFSWCLDFTWDVAAAFATLAGIPWGLGQGLSGPPGGCLCSHLLWEIFLLVFEWESVLFSRFQETSPWGKGRSRPQQSNGQRAPGCVYVPVHQPWIMGWSSISLERLLNQGQTSSQLCFTEIILTIGSGGQTSRESSGKWQKRRWDYLVGQTKNSHKIPDGAFHL